MICRTNHLTGFYMMTTLYNEYNAYNKLSNFALHLTIVISLKLLTAYNSLVQGTPNKAIPLIF